MIISIDVMTGKQIELPDAISNYIPPTVEERRANLSPLSAWQVRKVLTQLGLRDSVEAAVANADQATKDAWTYAYAFQRDDVILNAMAVSLGITDEQLDSMFELGITL